MECQVFASYFELVGNLVGGECDFRWLLGIESRCGGQAEDQNQSQMFHGEEDSQGKQVQSGQVVYTVPMSGGSFAAEKT